MRVLPLLRFPLARRCALGALAPLVVLTLAGCAGAPPAVREADGRLCHRGAKPTWQAPTCTRAPVPADASALAALPADARALTVYVLRGGWGDRRGRVDLRIHDQMVAETVPGGYLRLRLPPGRHLASSHWTGGRSETVWEGAAGEVLYVALEPPMWSWERPFEWVRLSDADALRRAAALQLLADVDQRR